MAANGGGRWRRRMVVDDVGGRWWWTVVKVNGEIINWYEIRKIVMRRYKIEGKKIGTK